MLRKKHLQSCLSLKKLDERRNSLMPNLHVEFVKLSKTKSNGSYYALAIYREDSNGNKKEFTRMFLNDNQVDLLHDSSVNVKV